MTPDSLTELDAAACQRLLEAARFGRLAIVDSGKPVIVVLNHATDDGCVIFRTADGTRLARLTQGGHALHAVFEVDSAFPVGQSGWSVLATGVLVREADPRRCALAAERIATWADGDRNVVLRLEVQETTGRRVGALLH
jgi:nitroimidazol reductase NimA-like FMN-containing flavoprotein (pyridoxamine 5'-phosphate oxidase superfamily)